MNRSDSGLGGSFSVDGQAVEVDLAEFGWTQERSAATADDGRVRLQKALAHAGVASRRACEALITRGRVEVNGEVVHELGTRIDPESDEVRVDGVVVQLDVSKRYFVLNKPRGVVSTMSDEQGRPDLSEYARGVEAEHEADADDSSDGSLRLYNVGRLDTDTSGLLVLTNDGELAHRLAHPSFGVQKTYIAKVRGRVTAATIQRLKDGIELSDGPIHADAAKLLPGGRSGAHSLVEITLHSGRNRIVRRMLADVGHPVVELVRRQFGPLHLGTMRIGELRELSAAERGALLSVVRDGGAGAGSGARDGAASGGGDRARTAKNSSKSSTKNSSKRGSINGSKAGSKSDSKRAEPAERRGAGRRSSEITAGRPGDGKGAKGMRGVAAKGAPRRGSSSARDNRTTNNGQQHTGAQPKRAAQRGRRNGDGR